jgi:hypothetical protein
MNNMEKEIFEGTINKVVGFPVYEIDGVKYVKLEDLQKELNFDSVAYMNNIIKIHPFLAKREKEVK